MRHITIDEAKRQHRDNRAKWGQHLIANKLDIYLFDKNEIGSEEWNDIHTRALHVLEEWKKGVELNGYIEV